ncbi:hypothetical protein [Amycolatopsis taiwanensis]|uniref:Uncharacterized protein n=1 Tax=Amycolatopsis taiwanensis TaxID=342230 RepID=A0A9W6QXR4_9PSEU|nr:hypothetical protein [Amycolatopsis taiwanensis]GLY63942.1 hypothetical protein Atai01_05610 [Amycolatopsis taiwanensis]
MSVDLSAVISATAQWLLRAYPPGEGALSTALAEAQARQAVAVAAWLRYPTAVDASLLNVVGPGGSGRLDWLAGVETAEASEDEYAWRTWVDEVVASWAACLLADPRMAASAASAVADSEHLSGMACDFRRLTDPDARDRQAAILLRHPDLLAPIAELHAAELHDRLDQSSAEAA